MAYWNIIVYFTCDHHKSTIFLSFILSSIYFFHECSFLYYFMTELLFPFEAFLLRESERVFLKVLSLSKKLTLFFCSIKLPWNGSFNSRLRYSDHSLILIFILSHAIMTERLFVNIYRVCIISLWQFFFSRTLNLLFNNPFLNIWFLLLSNRLLILLTQKWHNLFIFSCCKKESEISYKKLEKIAPIDHLKHSRSK
jgi:hypothetical protein